MRWLLLIWVVVLLLLSGCQSDTLFLKASRDRYEAIAPREENYIRADESLNDDQRETRLDTLRAWRFDLDKHGVTPEYKVRDDNNR